MTTAEARLKAFFDAADDNVRRLALALATLCLDLMEEETQEETDDDETVNAPETPAPPVVNQTPVNNAPAGETLEETLRRRRRELGIKGYDD